MNRDDWITKNTVITCGCPPWESLMKSKANKFLLWGCRCKLRTINCQISLWRHILVSIYVSLWYATFCVVGYFLDPFLFFFLKTRENKGRGGKWRCQGMNERFSQDSCTMWGSNYWRGGDIFSVLNDSAQAIAIDTHYVLWWMIPPLSVCGPQTPQSLSNSQRERERERERVG